MRNKRKINEFLKKLLDSHCFSKSVVNRELLKYLVEQSLKGETPKEYQIAYDVFGKDINAEKEHNIRIYIHNLRKKLTEYYSKEGKDDEVKFEIPKGGYLVVFNSDSKSQLKAILYRNSPKILGASFLFLLIAIFFFLSKEKTTVANKFIWKDFYKSDYPSLVVLGDHYFFRAKTPFGIGMVRHTNINSDEDLNKRINEEPETEDDISTTEQTYINKQAPFGLYKIMNFLGGEQVEIEMKYSSELRWEDTQQKNMIFIGSYKTQNILREVTRKVGVEFIVNKGCLKYASEDSLYVYQNTSDEYLSYEYASLIRFVTPDDRNIVMFMSNSDFGNFATMKFISKPENLKTLEKMVSQFSSQNFKCVFEVKGKQLTDFQINIIQIDPILDNIEEVWP